MQLHGFRLRLLHRLAVVSCVVIFSGSGHLLAQEAGHEEATDGTQQESPGPEGGHTTEQYPADERRYGTNRDPVERLNRSLPKSDSLFDASLPQSYSDFKTGLYEKHGLKLGVSYQSLYQKASESLTDTDSAWGGWFQFNGAWTAINRGQDLQGKLVLVLDGRHIINPSSHTAPGLLSIETGSLWPTDGAYLDWRIYPVSFFWEQRVKKERFAFRLGQEVALAVLDPFRFDEMKSSFTTSTLALPIATIPAGAPGLSLSAKWWPVKDSELYFSGIVSDINSPEGKVDWGGLFETGEIFAGVEAGHFWIREDDDFDHAHLTLWYADEVSTAPWATKAGWGFKVSGNKQWGRFVVFGDYAHNTAEGGGLGTTNTRQAVNLGAAHVNPLGNRGEVALGVSWGDPIAGELRSQSGLEVYWKILVMSNLWLTPGIQYIVHPTFNPETDSFSIAQLKFSFFF
jgi:hypothetical protein